MPTVYLPTEHSEAELNFASRVAEALECSALYVTWSARGYEDPACATVFVTPPATATQAPLTPTRGAWSRACARMAGWIAAGFRSPTDVEREQRP